MTKNLLSTLAIMIIISGCSNKNMTSQQSGFLGDYSQLKPSPYTGSALAFISPNADISSYKNIMIEPVKVIANNEEMKVKTGLMKDMSDYLTQKVKDGIERTTNFNLVTQVQENTLRLEFAITAVTVSHDDIEVYQFIPVALVVTGAARATGVVDKTTRVLAEMHITDANSGESLIKVIDLQPGEKMTVKDQEVTLELVKPAIDAWAERFSKRIERIRTRKK